jgi:hypothetical protein
MGQQSLRVSAGSLRFSIMAIGNVRVSLARASQAAIRAAGEGYRDAVRSNISLTDHTLRDLARLDHPYARRHGGIKLHGGDTNGGRISDGRSLVHRQSGRMVRGLRGALRGTGKRAAYEVWFDAMTAPHAEDVILGTRRMLPRDPLWDTATAPQTVRDMRLRIVRELGAVLRSQAIIRFKP